MSNNTEQQITQNVLDSMTSDADPRLRQVMSSLITHIHACIREVELTQIVDFIRLDSEEEAARYHVASPFYYVEYDFVLKPRG